jgi:predicted enzyme related to lactoylglutathione lyase
MPIEHLFAGIPVSDLDAAIVWYRQLFGRPPELLPNDREAAWRLTDSAWVCLIAGAGHATPAVHTLLVDDLDAFIDSARERHIETGEIEVLGSAARQIVIVDPDGNRLKVGQPITAD